MQFPRCPEQTTPESGLWEKNLCINTPASKFGWMGYSLRTVEWRYNAWFRWNGSTLAPIVPGASGKAGNRNNYTGVVVPANGTDGFFNELFQYEPLTTSDFNALEMKELAATRPDIVAQLHAKLLDTIAARG
jgi:hypothetical protein